MWRSRSANNFLPLDPEIDRILHRVRREVEARTRIEGELDIVVQSQPSEMADCQSIGSFVDGLDDASKMNLDSACGGSCMARPYTPLEEVPKKRKDKPIPEGKLIPKATHESKKNDETSEPVEAARSPPPFPQRLQKKNNDCMSSKFLSMFRKVRLNIPLVDVLRKIPKYTKYIKDIVTHKRTLTEFKIVALTKEFTSRVQNKLPQKLKDPGSFTIPVRIGNIDLADRSMTHPKGVIEDVLLQIGKFIFPADFIILDYEVDELVPIILGRPLLATGDAIIKVREGKMILRVDDEEAVFNIYKAMQLPHHYEELSMISVVDVDEQLLDTSVYLDDSLDKALMLFNILEIDDEGIHPFEPLNRPSGPPPKSSIEEAPKLELKPLPPHLQYAYLGGSDTLHVIVSSDLYKLQEEKLLRVLREHKRAIGWMMSDIKGISPAFCMHKILMEDGHNPSIEQQRHLNPIMKEVVRKEVIKCLDVGIVFPISDSKWVDKAKVEAIEKLPPPTSVKGIRSFLGHASFLIKTAPIIIAPDWEQPFELMCDAGDISIRAVLGQRRNKIFHSIYYESKTLNLAQMNYTVTEKELLAVVWAFDKFRSYLVGTKVIVYTDHSTIRYLFGNKDAKLRLIHWVLILQEFDLVIRDRKGTKNQVADHLSKLEIGAM
ncbi:uncharacterized protein [Nicotiana sylvestris]|uniref:uncharacterized protein n=1 Tax=Nicotiana sylvestris TaxID=4096 RepID=UPI00388CA182